MPAPLVEQGATVLCAHGGQAQPTVPNPRVGLGGKPALGLSPPWTITGCTFPPNSGGPCVTAMWSVGTVRVTSMKQPLVLASGTATCVPTGTPLTASVVQMRVTAT
ncbi:hypothetical protein [Tessaracoccus sp.]